MWWDATQITCIDSVMFTLFSMLLLYLTGWGILNLIGGLNKKNSLFENYDFLQKLNFRILFGFIFIVFTAMLFSVFNFSFIVLSLLIIGIATTGFMFRYRHGINLKAPNIFRVQRYTVLVLVLLFILIFILAFLVSGNYGSTNDDGADHTLVVRIIMANSNALITRSGQPYANLMLNYPTGAHVLCAFLVSLLGVSIQKIVMLVSVILPVLIALSFYSTIKCLFENKAVAVIGLIISGFFTINLSWIPVGWGGLPLLLSFYLSVCCVGIFYGVFRQKLTPFNALLLGLMFFITSQTYPDALFVAFLAFLLLSVMVLYPKLRNIRVLGSMNGCFFKRQYLVNVLFFVIPILLSVPYFYFVFSNNSGVFQLTQLSSFSNVSAGIVKERIGFIWLFDIPKFVIFFSDLSLLLALAPISLILIVLFFVSTRVWKLNFALSQFKSSLLFVYFLMLSIMAYLTLTLYLPVYSLSVLLDPQRVLQHLYVPAAILSSFVVFFGLYLFYRGIKPFSFSDGFVVKKRLGRVFSVVMSFLLLFSVVLFSGPVVGEQQFGYNHIRSEFDRYHSLASDDLLLMEWIEGHVDFSEVILVSAGDSGQFVTSITQRRTVSMYTYLKNYSDLMSMLTSNPSDLKAVPLLVAYNVSYVYIGSTATAYALQMPHYRHFNASEFLSVPYFVVAKAVGDAWLFQFNSSLATQLMS
jgi:hypothetical protein